MEYGYCHYYNGLPWLKFSVARLLFSNARQDIAVELFCCLLDNHWIFFLQSILNAQPIFKTRLDQAAGRTETGPSHWQDRYCWDLRSGCPLACINQ
jgi:hypothetical protein